MNTGWECPKCGRCYSPIVRECTEHAVPNQTQDSNKTFIGEKCKICGQLHYVGMPCPNWKVMSKVDAPF